MYFCFYFAISLVFCFIFIPWTIFKVTHRQPEKQPNRTYTLKKGWDRIPGDSIFQIFSIDLLLCTPNNVWFGVQKNLVPFNVNSFQLRESVVQSYIGMMGQLSVKSSHTFQLCLRQCYPIVKIITSCFFFSTFNLSLTACPGSWLFS